eukprot:3368840-Pleurochrysis_carterae.AAC.2
MPIAHGVAKAHFKVLPVIAGVLGNLALLVMQTLPTIIKRLSAVLTRTETGAGSLGARAGGLVVQLRSLVNQRRYDADLQGLSAA